MKKALKSALVCAVALGLTGCTSSTTNNGDSDDTDFTLNPTTAITVSGGEITGAYSDEEETVAVYKGIPYAAAPVGDLRWKAPQDVEEWEGVKECTEWGASAIQVEQAPFMMWSEEFIIEDTGYSEDCLTLNVWAKTDGDADKPVVVYIHGGGFTSGGSSCEVYDGEYLASQDVVYVSINYRVGILGYLAHPDLSAESEDGVSGNYGVLDQIKALEWVQENIAQFGGDPDNVTIMGQSAGAASVNDLILSPKAEGLFTKAFSMSYNSITSTFTTLEAAEESGKELFGDMTLEEMREMSTEELMALSFSGSPINDGVVLTGDPAEVLQNGEANDVTLLSGFVTGDTWLFTSFPTDEDGNYTKEGFISTLTELFGDNAEALIAEYTFDGDDASAAVAQFQIDQMQAQQNLLASVRTSGGAGDTYSYYFTHVMPGIDSELYGAFHTSDVPYFLNVFSDLRADYWTDDDYAVGEKASSYLINFAKTGNPNGEGLTEWNTNDGNTYLTIDVTDTETHLSDVKNEVFTEYYTSLVG